MTLVVTGASGFVASALIPALALEGHTGWAVARRVVRDLPFSWRWNNRETAFTSLRGADAILHLEVKQHVQNPSEAEIRKFTEVNLNGTKQWLDWASRNRVSNFVYFSSVKAAGSSARCQTESDSCAPDSAYGASKFAAERAVSEWASADCTRSAIVLRPAVVYGPGNQANMLSLVDAICRRRYFLIGENDNVKSLISLKNLNAAVCYLLAHTTPGFDVFYLTDRESFKVAQIVQMIGDIVGDDRPLRKLPHSFARIAARAGDVIARLTGRSFPLTTSRLHALTETTHFSCAKLIKTGFVHPQSTRDGLEEMVNWYLSTRGRV